MKPIIYSMLYLYSDYSFLSSRAKRRFSDTFSYVTEILPPYGRLNDKQETNIRIDYEFLNKKD